MRPLPVVMHHASHDTMHQYIMLGGLQDTIHTHCVRAYSTASINNMVLHMHPLDLDPQIYGCMDVLVLGVEWRCTRTL